MNTKAFWSEFDKLFHEMDKFFERMDRLFAEAKSVNENVHIDNPDEHKVRFRSIGGMERIKLTWQFFCMAVSTAFRGHATITFRRRKPLK